MAVDEDRRVHRPSVAISPQAVADAPDGYENLARIDQGGFAVVYRALDTRFDRIVALKILRSDSLDKRRLRRFSSECQATGRLSSHPNIVTVYDAGTTAGHRPWLAMEYCSGGSLAQKLVRTGPLPVAEVISIGARLCSALSAAHEAGILHRDVKPHNVLITSYGEPALADFGIASVLLGEDGSRATETAAYTVVHAAPEVVEGKAGNEAADLYSLGSTLYTLLAGQAPFAKEATAGLAPLVSRILRNDIPAIARHGVPPELEKLLRTCMARKPQDRPASAAELGASLTNLGLLVSAADTQPPGGARPNRSGADAAAAPSISARRLLVRLGGALVILLAAFTTWGASRPGSSPEVIPPGATARTATGAGAGAQRTAQATAQPTARTGSGRTARSSDGYTPTGLAVTRGQNKGELIVTWHKPISSAVVATVIYEGSGTTKARAIVTYNGSSRVVPTATVHGLPANQRVCLSAAHVVSVGDNVTNVVSTPVCAVPR